MASRGPKTPAFPRLSSKMLMSSYLVSIFVKSPKVLIRMRVMSIFGETRTNSGVLTPRSPKVLISPEEKETASAMPINRHAIRAYGIRHDHSPW